MARINQNHPPSRIRNRPDDYVVSVISRTVGRFASGAPDIRQRAYFMHAADYCAPFGQPLRWPAFIERDGVARGVLALADNAEQCEIVHDRDGKCRAAYRADRDGWGIPC